MSVTGRFERGLRDLIKFRAADATTAESHVNPEWDVTSRQPHATEIPHVRTSNSMSRRSLGQKRCREKEARENYKPETTTHEFKTSELASYRRSEAQKARRQRELAAMMEHDLLCKDQSSDSTHTVRSRAQRFRRRVEKAQKSLAANPDCVNQLRRGKCHGNHEVLTEDWQQVAN
ncbi:hypothetical protein C8J57DRAFT_1240705 [Mycena rebaudengoi]|nr:hypothetical protein C8J57DRAFT_1240705 [Mycena rebaudengoi]